MSGVTGFSCLHGGWMVPSRAAHHVLGGMLHVFELLGAVPRTRVMLEALRRAVEIRDVAASREPISTDPDAGRRAERSQGSNRIRHGSDRSRRPLIRVRVVRRYIQHSEAPGQYPWRSIATLTARVHEANVWSPQIGRVSGLCKPGTAAHVAAMELRTRAAVASTPG